MAKKFYPIPLKIILLCFEFQITIGAKPRYCFTLFSKHYSKTFWTLSNFFAHKFSKSDANISISKNTKKNTTRKHGKFKTNFECFHPFSFLFLTVDNYDSSSSNIILLNDIKVIPMNFITYVSKLIRFPNNCTYHI